MKEICQLKSAEQCVVLCTCNHTEIYFSGVSEGLADIQRLICKYGSIGNEELTPCIMQFSSDSAARHFFRAACGIDSMVIGEDEILGQTKAAYMRAKECGTAAYEMNMIFQSAIACAKKIKTRTELSRTSVSIATLAANEAAKFGDKVNVLLIGATGKTGAAVLKNLMSHKNVRTVFTLRNHAVPCGIAENSGARAVMYSERYSYTDRADCVITATSSPHYTITLQGLCESIKTPKDRLFINLAVPPDIDGEITEIDGVRLIGIDYFNNLAKENNALKLSSVESANDIISAELETLKKELAFHDFLPCLDRVREAAAEKTIDDLLYKLKASLSAEELSAVLEVLKKYGGNKCHRLFSFFY